LKFRKVYGRIRQRCSNDKKIIFDKSDHCSNLKIMRSWTVMVNPIGTEIKLFRQIFLERHFKLGLYAWISLGLIEKIQKASVPEHQNSLTPTIF
jgi:hypothetical protein